MISTPIFPSSFDAIVLDGVRAALLDLDDTLYSYGRSHAVGLAACFDYLPYPTKRKTFEDDYRAARDRVTARLLPQAACRSRLLAFQLLCEMRAVPSAYHHAAHLEQIYWRHFIDSITIDPHAKQFIDICRQKNIRLCIVTDMTAAFQTEKIAKLGLTGTIDYLVSSEEVGAEKPDARMFQAALEKLELDASDVIMVGDNEEKDVRGAQALGIQSYWIKAEAYA